MAQQQETLRGRTLENENLAGPKVQSPGVRSDRSNLTDRTRNNENLTAPGPDLSAPLEKDFSNGKTASYHHVPLDINDITGVYSNGYHQHLDMGHDSDTALRKIRTAGSISISPELFEKIYLSPQNKVHGDLRKTVANPTPL